MPVRRFEDLVVWQLSTDVKLRVYALLARTPASRDLKLCDQLRASAASAPAAIAEGFGRYHYPEFAHFPNLARGSLMEVQNHLRDGIDRGHWLETDSRPVLEVADRAIGATTQLLKHLKRSEAPAPPRRRH